MTGKLQPLQKARTALLSFPGVEEGPCYGTPGFRVRGKFLARITEDGETLVVKCGFEERDLRMQYDPEVFFTTDHYRGYPSVLIRLMKVKVKVLREVIEVGWRLAAPRRLQESLPMPGARMNRVTRSPDPGRR